MHFDWGNPYRSTRAPVFARNVVATSQPLAAQAGLRMLAQGGNAVDAAIAAAATITLTEPCSNGLGSDNFVLVWDPAQRRLLGLNASGTAPAAWTLDYFKRKYGDDLVRDRPVRGWDTVTVPGAVAGWVALHERLGRLPFADVLAPAIDYAERGFAVSPIVHDKWRLAAPLLQDQPGFAEHFLPRGHTPAIGELVRVPGLARSLRLIAQTKGEAFYRGEIASTLARHAAAHGGAMTEDDLAAYRPEWVDPIARGVRGRDGAHYALHEIPPNGQGIAALIALGIVDHLPIWREAIDGARIDRPELQHLLIEAMKLAFADTYAQVADARAMRVGPAQLLDDAYLAERARCIDARRAQDFRAGTPPRGGTIYLSTADEHGMMVSLIQSNYMGFGSGIVVPGTGVSLHNRGHGFSVDPAHPNCVAPGKRPFHTIIPAFLSRDGEPQMSFGVMGGNMQPQGHLQTLVRMLIAGQQPQAACDAPRWKWNHGLQIEVEAAMPAATIAGLEQRGHRIAHGQDSYMDFGAGQFIWRLGAPEHDGYVAASDARRDGCACGF